MVWDGYRIDAADDEAVEPWWERRATLVAGAVIVLLCIGILSTARFGTEHLPRDRFAGCYVSANGDPLQLDRSGTVRSRGSAVGTFEVDAPVGGKHGPLVDIDAVSIVTRGENVYFAPGNGGYFWEISDNELQVVFPPDHFVTFRKVTASQCG